MESSQDGAVFFKFKSKSMKVRSFVDIARCRCVCWVPDYCLSVAATAANHRRSHSRPFGACIRPIAIDVHQSALLETGTFVLQRKHLMMQKH